MKSSLIFLLTGIFFLSLTSICSAQSIVGKWKRNTTKNFTLDKATGKQVPVSAEAQKQYNDAISKNGYQETLEMKGDNSYVSTVTTTGAEPRSHEGKYTVTGKDLDMH